MTATSVRSINPATHGQEALDGLKGSLELLYRNTVARRRAEIAHLARRYLGRT